MMKKTTSLTKKILVGLIFSTLMIHTLFTLFPLIELQPLKGYTQPSEQVSLTAENWFNGSFQRSFEQEIADSSHLRSFLVRLHNETEFYCFDKVHVASVIQGQKGYLYDLADIESYLGSDFPGSFYVEDQVRKLKFIEQQLKPYGKSLVIVLVPGKSSLLPEYLPETIGGPGKRTCLAQYRQQLTREQLPFIDFANYFKRGKRTAAYPVFGKYAVHWSPYTSAIAADSIIRHIEHLYRIDLANCKWDRVEQKTAHGTDIDFLETLNLLHFPALPQMGYPEIYYDVDPQQAKPPLLAIGDSYFWGLPEFQTPFSNYHFWFYNNEVYPETSFSGLYTYQLDLKKELAQHDIFVILSSEANLKDIGWGAIDRIAQELKNPETQRYLASDYQKKTAAIIKDIRGVPEWLKAVESKAAAKRISLDSMLTLDARWVYHLYQQKQKH